MLLRSPSLTENALQVIRDFHRDPLILQGYLHHLIQAGLIIDAQIIKEAIQYHVQDHSYIAEQRNQLLTEAITRTPFPSPDLYQTRALNYLYQGQFKQALDDYQSSDALQLTAEAKDDKTEAIRAFLKAEELFTRANARTSVDEKSRAEIRIKAGELNKAALKISDDILEKHPDEGVCHLIKGLCLKHQEKFAEAANCFEQVSKLQPLQAKSYFYTADCYAQDGKYEQAFKAWEQFAHVMHRECDPPASLRHINYRQLLDDNDAKSIRDIASKFKFVSGLSCSAKDIPRELLDLLKQNQLTNFEFRTPIKSSFGAAMVHALSASNTRSLSLQYKGKRLLSFFPIELECLEKNQQLNALHLRGIIFEDLNEFLTSLNPSIHTLTLTMCYIDNAGIRALANFLRYNTFLRELKLADIKTDNPPESALLIAEALAQNRALRKLNWHMRWSIPLINPDRVAALLSTNHTLIQFDVVVGGIRSPVLKKAEERNIRKAQCAMMAYSSLAFWRASKGSAFQTSIGDLLPPIMDLADEPLVVQSSSPPSASKDPASVPAVMNNQNSSSSSTSKAPTNAPLVMSLPSLVYRFFSSRFAQNEIERIPERPVTEPAAAPARKLKRKRL